MFDKNKENKLSPRKEKDKNVNRSCINLFDKYNDAKLTPRRERGANTSLSFVTGINLLEKDKERKQAKPIGFFSEFHHANNQSSLDNSFLINSLDVTKPENDIATKKPSRYPEKTKLSPRKEDLKLQNKKQNNKNIISSQ